MLFTSPVSVFNSMADCFMINPVLLTLYTFVEDLSDRCRLCGEVNPSDPVSSLSWVIGLFF